MKSGGICIRRRRVDAQARANITASNGVPPVCIGIQKQGGLFGFLRPVPLGNSRRCDMDRRYFSPRARWRAAQKIIVSHDTDLPELGKPFGFEIVKPAIFVARFNK